METFGIALALGLVWGIVSWIWSFFRPHTKQRRAAIKAIGEYMDTKRASEGFEKIRLMLRESLVIDRCTAGLKCNMRIAVIDNYGVLCDYFYGFLDDTMKQIGDSSNGLSVGIVLAREVESNSSLRELLGYKVMVLAFLIVLAKAAETEHIKLSRKNIYSYIDKLGGGEVSRNEMRKIAKWFITYEKDDEFGMRSSYPVTSRELGEMAYSLLNADLKKKFGDLTIVTFMGSAISVAYKNTNIDEKLMKEIKSEKLISK